MWRALLGMPVGLAVAAAAAPSAQPAPALALPAVSLAYTLEARLDPESRGVDGVVELRWRSAATQPLERVPVHLYLNAFANSATTFAAGLDPEDLADRAEEWDDPWGSITLGEVTQPGAGRCAVRFVQPDDGRPFDRSLAEVSLAQPVGPGEELHLRLPFTARLPIPVSRTGGDAGWFFVGQWFPKLAAFLPAGWRGRPDPGFWARQFHEPTEFFADFADWDVSLDVPEGYQLFATGSGNDLPGAPGRLRRRFVQRAVHDFAWVAARDVHVETHAFTPPGGTPIAITYVVPATVASQVARMRTAAEHTFTELGRRVGPYPYDHMTILEPPWSYVATGGMEYPTLVTAMVGDPLLDLPGVAHSRWLELVLIHEVIHNYFQGLVANDEVDEAFLDEGFTSYWTGDLLERLASGPRWSTFLGYPIDSVELERRGAGRQLDSVHEPLARRPAYLFHPGTDRAQIYTRTSLGLETAARRFGDDAVDRVFAAYFARWRFAHPSAEDFLATADAVGPPELAALLRETFSSAAWPNYAVEELSSDRWQAPLGWVPGPEGVLVTPDDQEARTDERVGLDPGALEPKGKVTLTVTDPGWLDAPGAIRRQVVTPEHAEPAASWEPEANAFWVTRVRLTGPALRHLPVEVELRFADGVVVRDRWDGRAAWRGYELVRPAPLVAARVDPGHLVALDPRPHDHELLLEPSRRWPNEVAVWLGKLLAWLALGLGWWA